MMKKLMLGVMMLAIYATGAMADSAHDAALDERMNAVFDERGNCVRTKWMGHEDPCAPPKPEPVKVAKPAPAPAPAPEFVVTKDERTVYFGFDSAALDSEAEMKLENLAQKINASDAVKDVRVVGYTDQFGSASYNQRLSERRVAAVRNYLDKHVSLDLSRSEFVFRGLGKAPKTECSTISNRSARIDCMRVERRVELEMLTTHRK